ncbi:MAG: response regulator transcription factor [Paracoccaceae bacterium]
MRFLLVEDNLNLASATADRLSLDGHVVDHAPDLETAKDYVGTTSYDLVLLDIMLPDGDGRSFLNHLRTARIDTPVIAVTARSEVSDRVGILDLGADDYITKPFDFAELEARCRAVLRRRAGATSNAQRIGDIEFNRLAGTLSYCDETVALRTRELRLLELLVDNSNIILSKTKLVDRMFSYDEDVSENAIEVYIGRLRKHLAGSHVSITTIRGIGYRLDV